MAGEENHENDYAASEKIEEKSVYDNEKHDDVWLKDSKDIKLDNEEQSEEFSPSEEDLDMAIINDLAITDDDTTLRSITVRSLLIGTVSFMIPLFKILYLPSY